MNQISEKDSHLGGSSQEKFKPNQNKNFLVFGKYVNA